MKAQKVFVESAALNWYGALIATPLMALNEIILAKLMLSKMCFLGQ